MIACAAPTSYTKQYNYDPKASCALLAIDEQEIAVIPIKELRSVFDLSGSSKSVDEFFTEKIAHQLSDISKCFRHDGNIFSSTQHAALDFRKFDEKIGSNRVRVNVLSGAASSGEYANNPDFLLIINNITVEYVLFQGNYTAVPSGNSGVSQSSYKGLSVRYEYALQNLDSLEILAYGVVIEDKDAFFSSKTGVWDGLIRKSSRQLLKKLKMD